MNFPELPKSYNKVLEENDNLRLLYCSCDQDIGIPAWKVYKICLQLDKDGHICNLNAYHGAIQRLVLEKYHEDRLKRYGRIAGKHYITSK